MSKLISRFVVIGIVIAVVVGFKVREKNKVLTELRPDAVVLMKDFPNYVEHQEYYDSAFESLHRKAFDYTYKLGGKYTPSSFDFDKYHTVLIALFMRDAKETGKPEIATQLKQHRVALDLPEVEFN